MAKQNIMKAIDDLRATVVGKIPMPNSQVEQITLALLYKFMDDMDQSSIDFGGNATFFSKEFEKYSWKKIMSNCNSAQVRYNLYTEALEKFYAHPDLPDTFREIFKNATVPYKDAETLTNFLKIIDSEFDYSDSEQLGDAYEYLLSVLGSQGDLGQFRTPRHIIDFIVELVDPDKNDKILDPACGTAGFLISAYKYILKQNTDKISGDKLTFDEKKDILKNINGYDIEPSMVRIAEMNLFLHGATEPKIFEYDTLTMDDRWNDKY
ncbi:MAG: N-6 DNA methylase, partial [Bacilli bacterium]